jgi:hypothetical protein
MFNLTDHRSGPWPVCASGIVTVSGPVTGSGPTGLKVRLEVALGLTVVGSFSTFVALGSAPSCPVLIELGLVLAAGDAGVTLGNLAPGLAVAPTPPIARPRCAKLTLVRNASNIPQTSNFFMLAPPLRSMVSAASQGVPMTACRVPARHWISGRQKLCQEVIVRKY